MGARRRVHGTPRFLLMQGTETHRAGASSGFEYGNQSVPAVDCVGKCDDTLSPGGLCTPLGTVHQGLDSCEFGLCRRMGLKQR